MPKASFVFWRSMSSMVLLWISFPPVGWSFLAWFALLPLIDLIIHNERLRRSHYLKVWIASFFYWLATFYFIPIPHPALWAGWLVISSYLAFYLPLFVLSASTLNRRFRIPYLIAIPICWTGLELIRSYLFTGMGLVCLSHTQFEIPVVIQIADLFGAYTLSFAIVFVTTGVCQLQFIRHGKVKLAFTNLGLALLMIASVLAYGKQKINEEAIGNSKTINVGLIQGSVDTIFPNSQDEQYEFERNKADHYYQLTVEALAKWEQVDLLIWPENGWPTPDLHPDTDKQEISRQELQMYDEATFYFWSRLFASGKSIPPMLVGSLTIDPVKRDRYGSAICFDSNGKVISRYYKNHLVMFGEYVPLADWFPLLQRIPGIGKGLIPGTQSTTLDIKGVKLTPSICFETTVPHYIRNQVNWLEFERHSEPDILVNVTNDGWFYGTSCLDFHLACNVFRAIENRKPLLVCANTGFSAHIDHTGKIIQRGPRRAPRALLAKVQTTNMTSMYRLIGDWIPIAFACIVLIGCAFGFGNDRNDHVPTSID